MSLWERLAEQKLRRAIEDGLLEDLPGRGRRLEMPDDVLVPEEWRAAWHVLKTSGHLPDWLALRKAAQEGFEAACDDLRRAARAAGGREGDDWRGARERFLQEVERSNHRIDQANLRARHPSLQRVRFNPQQVADAIWRETHDPERDPSSSTSRNGP